MLVFTNIYQSSSPIRFIFKEKAMNISSEEAKTLLKDPAEAAAMADLIYISEDSLDIQRKKVGRGYAYYRNGQKITNSAKISRFKKIVIPPGWQDVRICHLPHGHLQVVGKDDQGRKQYLYHPSWSKLRNQTKFFKMSAFGKVLPKIRKQVEKDLDLPEINKRKVIALVIRLMEETHIRIGSGYYAKKNQTYGLSTLRTRHVKTYEDKIQFDFTGKKGKQHSISIKDKKLIKLVNQCEEIPGWELFKFYDEDGKKDAIDSGMINEYIREVTNDLYSAKDFRTWSATKIFFETLKDIGYTEDEKQNKKNILTAYDAAAKGLGNTRTVCRSYYVHPHVVALYENGGIVPFFQKIKSDVETNYASLSEVEKVLLKMISEYEIEV